MTTGITDIAKQKLLNNLISGSLYLGLATAVPSAGQATLASVTEVSTAGYARVPLAFNAATFPAPVFVSNSASVSFGPVTADMAVGANYAFLTDQATATTLSAPSGLTLGTIGSAGSWAVPGSYFWTVTALNAQGETVVSNEVTGTVGASGSAPLSWTAVAGATAYNLYRGTTSGGENVLVNSSPIAGTTYTDTGAVGVSQKPPSVTTAPAGNIWYVWDLASPAQALNGNPIVIPIAGLTIQ